MSHIVYVGGQKGGAAKTTTGHLICLGATLRREPADYVLTDPKRELKSKGRPYSVWDGREATKLAHIITTARMTSNGWLIVDGGGNRPAFDGEMVREADLVLLPFRDSEEDIEAVSKDMSAFPHALAWPAAWPTNRKARQAAQWLIDGLKLKFPLRVIDPPLLFVNSAKELLAEKLDDPSTPTRNAARKAFDVMTAQFELYGRERKTEQPDEAMAG